MYSFFAASVRPVTTHRPVMLAGVVLLLALGAKVYPISLQQGGFQVPPSSTAPSDLAANAEIKEAYGKLPLSFEVNQGQSDSEVRFISRGSGYTLFLTSTGAVLSLPGVSGAKAGRSDDKQDSKGVVLRMGLVGANPHSAVRGSSELPGKVNYLLSDLPSKWRTDVLTYSKVHYEDVYPGIDMVYYGNQRQLEYDFTLAPRADPGSILLNFEGADRIEIAENGDLLLRVGKGEVRQRKPFAYQIRRGLEEKVPSRYVLRGERQVGFELGSYDRSKPLIIDPVLAYSTYLGGDNQDEATSIAVDALGNAYITGYHTSPNFPSTSGAYDRTYDGVDDFHAFVTKLDPTGSKLLYSTYLGGSHDDGANGIAVDSSGSAYVTGFTSSTGFPTTSGAYDRGADDYPSVFVTKLDPSGSKLVYSTLLGAGGGASVAVDSSGNAYVTGYAVSGFPTTAGAYDRTYNSGAYDTFVAKLDASGSSLLYSTYLGGSRDDQGHGIASDSSGNAYVVGTTLSGDFPTTAGVFDSTFGGGSICWSGETPCSDAFVTKLDAGGSSPLYSGYLGGSGDDYANEIAVDASGNVYVTGTTSSREFPVTVDAYDSTLEGSTAAFVAKLNAGGSSLRHSTFLGGGEDDHGTGIALDPSRNVYVAGRAASGFPTTAGAHDRTFNGDLDAFVTKLELDTGHQKGGSDDQQGGQMPSEMPKNGAGGTAPVPFPYGAILVGLTLLVGAAYAAVGRR